jgi:hypothetical protein
MAMKFAAQDAVDEVSLNTLDVKISDDCDFFLSGLECIQYIAPYLNEHGFVHVMPTEAQVWNRDAVLELEDICVHTCDDKTLVADAAKILVNHNLKLLKFFADLSSS